MDNNSTETRKRKYDDETSPDTIESLLETETIVETENISMKKQVGLWSGVALILGAMIGSGIFISPAGVLRGTGSVGGSLLVWAVSGVYSMLGALCLAELGTMIPKSGGSYVYLMEGLGHWLAYLFMWTVCNVLCAGSIALVSLSFAEYICDPFYEGCEPPEVVVKMLAAAAIITIAIMNGYSVKLTTRIQVVFMGAKLAALALIIIGGLVHIAQGNTQFLENTFEGTTANPSRLVLAFYNSLFAFSGWNCLNNVVEEIQNPSKTLPRAILIAVPLVTVLNLLTIVSYFSVLSKEAMLSSPAVAVTWGVQILGAAAPLIPLAVALSVFGTANGSIFVCSRLPFVAAREGHMPGFLSYLHVKYLTPIPSLVYITVLSLVFLIPGDIGRLINLVSFSDWVFNGATALALIVMRFTKKDLKRPYKVPIVIPVIFLLVAVYLVIAPIVDNPRIEILYSAMAIVAGLVFYIPFVHYKIRLRCVEKLAMGIQLYMEVVPSKYQSGI